MDETPSPHTDTIASVGMKKPKRVQVEDVPNTPSVSPSKKSERGEWDFWGSGDAFGGIHNGDGGNHHHHHQQQQQQKEQKKKKEKKGQKKEEGYQWNNGECSAWDVPAIGTTSVPVATAEQGWDVNESGNTNANANGGDWNHWNSTGTSAASAATASQGWAVSDEPVAADTNANDWNHWNPNITSIAPASPTKSGASGDAGEFPLFSNPSENPAPTSSGGKGTWMVDVNHPVADGNDDAGGRWGWSNSPGAGNGTGDAGVAGWGSG